MGDLFRLLHRPLGDGAEGQPGRQGQAFLGRSEHEVQPPGIRLQRSPSQRGNRIHQDQHLGETLAHRPGDLPKRVHHPGGGLVVHQGDGLNVRVILQRRHHLLRADPPSPFDGDRDGLFAVGQGDLIPAFPEGAVDQTEDLPAHQVAHGGLPQAGARSGDEEDAAAGSEDGLQAGEDPFEERRKLPAPVADHRPGLGPRDLLRDVGGARDEQHGSLLHRMRLLKEGKREREGWRPQAMHPHARRNRSWRSGSRKRARPSRNACNPSRSTASAGVPRSGRARSGERASGTRGARRSQAM
ncbi:hypothetical protein HRbin22_02517 [Candidatus Thermoflexus japonica]|uniref:Uncharacterized protein n=1 Tax=Candidatus Thermoflexus japonica TaxID=2035417 RepID=A0A2H5YA05_9CHLR|nr:hypothetical protein HRbin22_02517 [Candidatus Thermoflexus japonica]